MALVLRKDLLAFPALSGRGAASARRCCALPKLPSRRLTATERPSGRRSASRVDTLRVGAASRVSRVALRCGRQLGTETQGGDSGLRTLTPVHVPPGPPACLRYSAVTTVSDCRLRTQRAGSVSSASTILNCPSDPRGLPSTARAMMASLPESSPSSSEAE